MLFIYSLTVSHSNFSCSDHSHVENQTRGKVQHRCTVIVHDKNIHISAVAKTTKAAKRMAARRALLRIKEKQEVNCT